MNIPGSFHSVKVTANTRVGHADIAQGGAIITEFGAINDSGANLVFQPVTGGDIVVVGRHAFVGKISMFRKHVVRAPLHIGATGIELVLAVAGETQ